MERDLRFALITTGVIFAVLILFGLMAVATA